MVPIEELARNPFRGLSLQFYKLFAKTGVVLTIQPTLKSFSAKKVDSPILASFTAATISGLVQNYLFAMLNYRLVHVYSKAMSAEEYKKTPYLTRFKGSHIAGVYTMIFWGTFFSISESVEKVTKPIYAWMLGGIGAESLSYPLKVFITNIRADSGSSRPTQIFLKLKKEGKFYRGFSISCLRSSMLGGITCLCKEIVLKNLSK